MYSNLIRYFVLAGITLIGIVVLLFGLLFVDTALSIVQRLNTLPIWLQIGIGGFFLLISLGIGWIFFGVLRQPEFVKKTPKQEDVSLEKIEEQITQADVLGADTQQVKLELDKLNQRKQTGDIHVALFGEISSGKSTLIRALIPDSELVSGVVGGTTTEIREYIWTSSAGDRLTLVDLPGLQQASGTLDSLASDEALRAHIVIYLCEGDLSRSQLDEITLLLKLGKPLIVAINKMDRFSESQLLQIKQRVEQHIAQLDQDKTQVVSVSAGGRHEVILIDANDMEHREVRELPPQVAPLQLALQQIIDDDPATLEQLRDSAVFVLASRQLDDAISSQRREQAARLIEGYSKKAIAGAMAAITPGTDLLIQGWLATRMVKELCELYDVPVRQVELDRLLEMIKSRTSKATAIILAIAGNAMKAFPGAGTLIGGAMHAVAYGIIFNALGKSVAASLESRGELKPLRTAEQFKEIMGENLEATAKHYAGLAFNEIKRLGTGKPSR